MTTYTESEQRAFILAYLEQCRGADACCEQFHAVYHKKFGGKRAEKLWGAQPVYKAQRLLSKMYKEGQIARFRVNLSGIGVGYPKWVYVYELLEH